MSEALGARERFGGLEAQPGECLASVTGETWGLCMHVGKCACVCVCTK